MQGIMFMKNLWPIISDKKYWTVDEVCRLVDEAHDDQWAITGSPVCTWSVSQLPGHLSPQIYLQTQEAVRLGFCSTIHHLTYNTDYAQIIHIVITEMYCHSRTDARWYSSDCSMQRPAGFWLSDWASDPGSAALVGCCLSVKCRGWYEIIVHPNGSSGINLVSILHSWVRQSTTSQFV